MAQSLAADRFVQNAGLHLIVHSQLQRAKATSDVLEEFVWPKPWGARACQDQASPAGSSSCQLWFGQLVFFVNGSASSSRIGSRASRNLGGVSANKSRTTNKVFGFVSG